MPLGQVLLRGGAASSGINYLSDALDTRKIREEDALRRMAQGRVSPYARRSDPGGLCSVPDPFAGGVGYPKVRGYRYEGHTGTAGKGGFNLADFGKELLTGFVAGGLSSAAFYGAGKAVEAVKGSSRKDLYRKGSNTGNFKNLKELMQLKNAKNVANKAGVGLEGIKIKIDRNPELLGRNVYGYTDGKTITLYPDAFSDTETLVRTLGHERMHIYQVGMFGKPTSTDVLGEFERGALMSEQSWWDYYNFKNGG